MSDTPRLRLHEAHIPPKHRAEYAMLWEAYRKIDAYGLQVLDDRDPAKLLYKVIGLAIGYIEEIAAAQQTIGRLAAQYLEKHNAAKVE